MSARQERLRIGVTAAVFGLYFVLVLARVFDLCVLDSATLKAAARNQHLRMVSLPPERGPIVDRNGDLMALTVESAGVFVDPNEASFGPEAIPLLAGTLELPADLVAQKVRSEGRFAWLLRATTPEHAAAVRALRLPGIGTKSSRSRFYPHGPLGGQLLGFAGFDNQGLEGIELAYDAELRGASSSVPVRRDARGGYIMIEGAPDIRLERGARVELTVDVDLQRIVEDEVEGAVMARRAKAGVAMVMDPTTGEILAMANVPRFDPNLAASADAGVRRNRAVTDRYEPGSTFKTILAAAAIEADVVLPRDRFFCENGRYAIGKRTISDHDPYGWLTFADVIRFSSNIGAAKVAERLGSERFVEAIGAFGFGQRSGIDLPGEVAGVVRPASHWKRIHLATAAFGHGIDVTPLQMLRAYAAIANGGRLMRPYVVRRVVGADGTVLRENFPQVVGRPISADTARIVTDILRGVVESGTGTAARIEGVAVAGKTGTARRIDPATGRYSKRRHVASFAGYFPLEAPRFAVVVVIDEPRAGTYGGVVAAPVFRRIGEYLADRHGLRVTPAPSSPGTVAPEPPRQVAWSGAADEGMPSYLGMAMRAAIARGERAGWEVETAGSGFVIAQDPPPGTKTISGRKLRLRFGVDLG